MSEGEISSPLTNDAESVAGATQEKVIPKTPEERSSERNTALQRLVALEQAAIGNDEKYKNLKDAATLDALDDPQSLFPHVDTSEESQKLRNELAKSAWDEFCEAYPDKIDLYQKYSDASMDEFVKLDQSAEVQDMMKKFEEEHPEAAKIYAKFGMKQRDRFGNVKTGEQRWWKGASEEEDEDSPKEDKPVDDKSNDSETGSTEIKVLGENGVTTLDVSGSVADISATLEAAGFKVAADELSTQITDEDKNEDKLSALRALLTTETTGIDNDTEKAS